jgi:protein-S-isoprenylcysteine O-methyltransferase Ste14
MTIDVAGVCFRHRAALLALVAVAAAVVAVAAPAQPLDLGGALAGAVLTVGGTLLRLAAMRAIGKRARVLHAGAEALQTEGPYARVRNPLYLANGSIAAGLVLLGGGWTAAATLVLGCAIIYEVVVRHEERWLAATFGEAFDAYCARVPRWLPLGPAAPIREPQPWAEVLWRERRLVVGVPLGVLAVVLVRVELLPARAWLDLLAGWLSLTPPALLALAGLVSAWANVAFTERKLRRKEALRAAMAQQPAQVAPR